MAGYDNYLWELAQKMSNNGWGDINECYNHLQSAINGGHTSSIQELYPDLWAFIKDIYETFLGHDVSSGGVDQMIVGGLRSEKRPEMMATSFSFRCGICGKCCEYRFLISDESRIRSYYIDHEKMEKEQMFREMGRKFSNHCPYARR